MKTQLFIQDLFLTNIINNMIIKNTLFSSIVINKEDAANI